VQGTPAAGAFSLRSVLPLVESFFRFGLKVVIKYEGLKWVFPLGNLLVIEQARDAGTKPAFCQIQLASAGCPEILRQRCDQIDWRIVLSMSESL
jgi:hypothetical protein